MRPRPRYMSTREPCALVPPRSWSAGIGLKSSARVGVRHRLHELADLRFQIFVGHDQRADGRAHVATARRNRMVERGLKPVIHAIVAASISAIISWRVRL